MCRKTKTSMRSDCSCIIFFVFCVVASKQLVIDLGAIRVRTRLLLMTIIGTVLLITSTVFLAPAVTVGETEGAMDSTFVFFCLFFCL